MKTLFILFGLILAALGVCVGIYLFFWWGLVEPIVNICRMVDAHSITATGIAWELVKFFVRDIVAVLVGGVIFAAGAGLVNVGNDMR